jgi:hypothetical protein
MPFTNFPDGISTSNLIVTDTATIANLSISNLDIAGFSTGSVLFTGPDGVISQDNSNLFWDNTNNRLGIGKNTPQYHLHVQHSSDTDGIIIQNNTGGSGSIANLYFSTYADSVGVTKPNVSVAAIDQGNFSADLVSSLKQPGNISNLLVEKFRISYNTISIASGVNLALNNLIPGQLLYTNASKIVSGSTAVNSCSPVWNSSDNDFDWVFPGNTFIKNATGIPSSQINLNVVLVPTNTIGKSYRLVDFLLSVQIGFVGTGGSPGINIMDLVTEEIIATIPYSQLNLSGTLVNLLSTGVTYDNANLFSNAYTTIALRTAFDGSNSFTSGTCSMKIIYELV